MARRYSSVERAATALAAASGVAHLTLFTIFALRVVGRGIGAVGYAVLAVVALFGLACNFVGYYLIRHGNKTPAGRFGVYAIALSTALAGVLLAVASITS